MGCCYSSKPKAHLYKPRPPSHPLPAPNIQFTHTSSAEFDDVFADIDDLEDDTGTPPPHTPLQSPVPSFHQADDDNFGDIEDSDKLTVMAADGNYSSKSQRLSEVRTLRDEIERHGEALAHLDSQRLVQELAQVIHAKSRQCDAAFARKTLDHAAYMCVNSAIEETRLIFEQFLARNPELLLLARREMFSPIHVVPLGTTSSPARTRPSVSRGPRSSLSRSLLMDDEMGFTSSRSRSRAASPAPDGLGSSPPPLQSQELADSTAPDDDVLVFG